MPVSAPVWLAQCVEARKAIAIIKASLKDFDGFERAKIYQLAHMGYTADQIARGVLVPPIA